MEEVINEIFKYGLLIAVLLIILILIVQKPERAYTLKALITKPFFRLFRWFSKGHIASNVSSNANEFLNSSVFSQLTHSDNYVLKVKWVTEKNDPILSKNGTLILRLKEEDDQTRNILSAVHTALPSVLCPLIRKNINPTIVKSIDLTVLKKLSSKLGKHGKLTFKKYFLDPETDIDFKINELISKLQSLDEYGFFIPIFINELELLSEGLFVDNDITDYSERTLHFLEYLLVIVNRKIGEEIQLEYLAYPYKVSTILLARAERADKQGLRPYLNRLNINLDKGSETIYIISFPPAYDFFKRLINVLESHDRVFIKKIIKTKGYHIQNDLKIAILARNEIFSNQLFEEKLLANNISEGSKVSGIIEDISLNEALVNIFGMRAYIQKDECSWISIESCFNIFEQGKEYNFVIKKIDKSKSIIFLTLKTPDTDPWNIVSIPKLNSIININIHSYNPLHLKCIYQDKLEVYMMTDELSWFSLTENQCKDMIGTNCDVKVINIDDENKKIFCSIRQTDENPWQNIHESLKIGMEFNGKVSDINPNNIQIKLPNNYYGFIPKEELELAGHEFKNYMENVVIGQGIDVYISKVFIEKQKIRLDLVRNKNK